eukprot:gb/GEZN01021223.1/.p2 GENE.gb/GEZN01021223.1/~~gb/GEZN01021223.1/.p2  ORF type:complete len:100 (-),score=13.47 gb/GEZN01021223.1/:275-574(-)
MKTKLLRIFVTLAGSALSLYSLYVHKQHDLTPGFVAGCDFSATWSCSKVFKSKWGRGFGVLGDLLGKDSVFNQPNGVFGAVYYLFVLFFGGSSKKSTNK